LLTAKLAVFLKLMRTVIGQGYFYVIVRHALGIPKDVSILNEAVAANPAYKKRPGEARSR
jgi:hypothetical protein